MMVVYDSDGGVVVCWCMVVVVACVGFDGGV